MITITSVGVVVALAALIWFANHRVGVVLRSMERIIPTPSPDDDPYDDEHVWSMMRTLTERIGALERGQADVLQAVAEGIDHAERNEKRVRGIVQGAQKRFEKSGLIDVGVEAEADTLPEQYEIGGGEAGVLPLHESLAEQDNPWNVVPGMRG